MAALMGRSSGCRWQARSSKSSIAKAKSYSLPKDKIEAAIAKAFGAGADALLKSNLVEVVLASSSDLANRTLREVDFRTMFDAGVVGIRRGDKRLTGQLGRIPLRVGDSLLLAAGADFFQHRNLDRNFHILNGSGLRPKLSPTQSTAALSGFALVIALAAFDVLPLFAGLLLLLALPRSAMRSSPISPSLRSGITWTAPTCSTPTTSSSST